MDLQPRDGLLCCPAHPCPPPTHLLHPTQDAGVSSPEGPPSIRSHPSLCACVNGVLDIRFYAPFALCYHRVSISLHLSLQTVPGKHEPNISSTKFIIRAARRCSLCGDSVVESYIWHAAHACVEGGRVQDGPRGSRHQPPGLWAPRTQ